MASLLINPSTIAEDSAQSFRQQYGFLPYDPPTWVLEGYFIARERNPGYVFGPVQKFVQAMGNTTNFLKRDFLDYRSKLMAVCQDERIASICSQMPNLTIMATNAAAAVEQTRL